MLREDTHRHILQERHVRLGETEGDGLRVDDGDLLDVLIVRRVFRAVLGVHDGLDGELDVVGRERLAVMPLHALAQVEGISIGLLVIVPRLGEAGDNLVVAVVGGQAVEEQEVDLAVFIHGGIDARIVGGAVDKGGAAAARGASAASAGRERQHHHQRQQQRHGFFHKKFPFFFRQSCYNAVTCLDCSDLCGYRSRSAADRPGAFILSVSASAPTGLRRACGPSRARCGPDRRIRTSRAMRRSPRRPCGAPRHRASAPSRSGA